jgi:hypothetical protein
LWLGQASSSVARPGFSNITSCLQLIQQTLLAEQAAQAASAAVQLLYSLSMPIAGGGGMKNEADDVSLLLLSLRFKLRLDSSLAANSRSARTC